MDRPTFFRIYEIDKRIRSGVYPNCRRLAEELEVSERSILRDVDLMKGLMGAPILYSKSRNGYYYGDGSFSLPDVKLAQGELLAVFLGAELLKKYRGTPFGKAVRSAFEKIELMLPDTVTVDFGREAESYSFDIRQEKELGGASAKVFDALAKAVKDKKSVEMTYYSIGRDRTAKRTVDPYHLRHAGSWYLIGYDHGHKDIRTYAVDQIRELKVQSLDGARDKGASFKVQDGFSPEKFFAHSWGIIEGQPITKVVVKLDKSIARWFKNRKLHSSQQTAVRKDGSLILSFEVSGTDEIKRWIMSQGANARVVEPKELREEIRGEAHKMGK